MSHAALMVAYATFTIPARTFLLLGGPLAARIESATPSGRTANPGAACWPRNPEPVSPHHVRPDDPDLSAPTVAEIRLLLPG